MDGSGTTFLQDAPYFSSLSEGMAGGILYIEDFDLDPVAAEAPAGDGLASPQVPAPTQEDVHAAFEAGRTEGLTAALAEASLVQAQLNAAALQNVADALNAARAALDRIAQRQAEEGARAVLGVLQAAIPATMTRHARSEIDAVVKILRPGLACAPALRVRAHPDLADSVRETLIGLLPADGGVLSVAADPTLAPADIQLAWQDGGARRDCVAIWDEIRGALAPLGLPAIEEICRGGC